MILTTRTDVEQAIEAADQQRWGEPTAVIESPDREYLIVPAAHADAEEDRSGGRIVHGQAE